MKFLIEDLVKSEEFESNIRFICSFNNAKCNFTQGRIINVMNTNISFIEPHRIDVTIKSKKIMLIYYNKNNLFLYNRKQQIDTKKLDTLLKEVKGMVV